MRVDPAPNSEYAPIREMHLIMRDYSMESDFMYAHNYVCDL